MKRSAGLRPAKPVPSLAVAGQCPALRLICGFLALFILLLGVVAQDTPKAKKKAAREAASNSSAPSANWPTGGRVEEFVFKKTPQGELRIHVHYPPDWKATDKRPAILFFFGGAWRNGSPTQFLNQAEYLAARGLVAARADYRVSSRQQTTPDKCVEDAKSAMRWLRGHAKELGADPDRIVGSGGSAGGHLAAATALVEGFDATDDDKKVSCKPNALVLFNPVFNLETVGMTITNAAGESIGKAISPIAYLGKGAVPAVIFFGTADRLLGQGTEFLAKSKPLGNRVELWTAADMPHGFFNRAPWKEITLRQADEFLASIGYVKGEPTLKLPEGTKASLKREN
jgi:acetyl esterase/lipase